GLRHDVASLHVVQHPRRGDASLGGVEHQHTADIALASELVFRPRKDASRTIKIVARREAVLGDKRPASPFHPHAGCSIEDFVAQAGFLPFQAETLPPANAASMQASMDNSAGA